MDHIDFALLRALQNDASLSQRELAEIVGLSQNACWRRLHALRESGVIKNQTIKLDAKMIGLGLTIFVLIKTRQHSKDWQKKFRESVITIPNVIDFHRLAGDYDYLLKIIVADMNDFDKIYQTMISKVEIDTVTSYISMEEIENNRNIPI
ncbi:Lrp/AsnC family transcriptional regulator [Kozakia baliensis]|uniref:Transcriptional regulator n=1 Tax=Kozakia baliensis TaxID=153496 RepID=A0A1D8UVX9_9PROT|nr:Lrp/AsnC family transcriptional regulator [Kozakia baliensis]AOX17845.1 transcriptional regulator [Kozakia baliensis]GBR33483.1 AsnC family transcriptional regulator [Kozakia baliensis NRIC 0488]GEL64939.1 transcriptional regulator [Kozakia baliensis]